MECGALQTRQCSAACTETAGRRLNKDHLVMSISTKLHHRNSLELLFVLDHTPTSPQQCEVLAPLLTLSWHSPDLSSSLSGDTESHHRHQGANSFSVPSPISYNSSKVNWYGPDWTRRLEVWKQQQQQHSVHCLVYWHNRCWSWGTQQNSVRFLISRFLPTSRISFLSGCECDHCLVFPRHEHSDKFL